MNSFQEFITAYPHQSFKKGEMILLKNEVPRDICIVQTGIVKLYTITTNGDERLIAFSREDEDFPLGYALDIVDRSQYFHEAFTNCTIRFVPKSAYAEYMKLDSQAMQLRLVRLTSQLLASHAHVTALEQTRASEKIAGTLLYMANQFGVLLRPYKTRLKLSITQQEIANALGLTRETINIELKKLELKHLFSHTRKSYVLYMERLSKYFNEI